MVLSRRCCWHWPASARGRVIEIDPAGALVAVLPAAAAAPALLRSRQRSCAIFRTPP